MMGRNMHYSVYDRKSELVALIERFLGACILVDWIKRFVKEWVPGTHYAETMHQRQLRSSPISKVGLIRNCRGWAPVAH